MTNKKKINNKKLFIYIYFIACFLICLWRAFKGFCWTDESFYYSTADRFFRGDALLKTEWYRTQCSSVFCLPFYAIFVTLTGSNTGVILYFRILYLLLSFGVALTVRHVISREYPESVGMIMATLICFYCHLNITSLSYYMLSMDFLLLSMILIYDYKNTDSDKELILAGSVFALAVLSMPALVVGYFGVMLLVLILIAAMHIKLIPEGFREAVSGLKLPGIVINTTIGIMIPAIIFIIYMLSKVSISEIITALPNIMVDNEHDFTLGFLVRKFFRSIKEVYGGLTNVAYLLIMVTFVFQKWLRKRPISDCIVMVDLLLFIALAYRSFGHTGYIQAAFVLFALPVFFVSRKKNLRLFFLLGGWGMILAVTYCFTSSDFLYVCAIGYFIVALACVAFLYDYASQDGVSDDDAMLMDKGVIRKIARLSAICLSLTCLYFACVTVALRLTNVYRDAPIARLSERITDGPAKGLYTTREHLDYYDALIKVMDEYMKGEGNVLFSKVLPWGYLYSEKACGYPTTWRATSYNEDQLNAYYEANPDKYPDTILVLNEYIGSYDAAGDVEDDHNPNLDEMNDYWKNYIKDNNMEEIELSLGKLYIK